MSSQPGETTERVPLIAPDDWDADLRDFVQRALLTEEEPLNFFKAMAHHPKLLEKWTVFAARLLGKGILEPREREVVVLRTVYNCGATYEWVHHAEIAQTNGLSTADIAAIEEGPTAASWGDRERALLRAADELHEGCTINDDTFEALRKHYDYAELLEIVMLAGNYHLVSYFVRSFGVPLEPGVGADADE